MNIKRSIEILNEIVTYKESILINIIKNELMVMNTDKDYISFIFRVINLNQQKSIIGNLLISERSKLLSILFSPGYERKEENIESLLIKLLTEFYNSLDDKKIETTSIDEIIEKLINHPRIRLKRVLNPDKIN